MSEPLPPPTPDAAGWRPPPPPAGPTPYRAAPSATRSAGLRTATTVLFWCAAASTVALAGALAFRKNVWSDIEDAGVVVGDITRLQDADDAVGAVGAIVAVIGLATTIVLSIWSLRVARRARAAGASNVSPGLACGGWYIPFANAIVPFVQLRRAGDHERRPLGRLNAWQGLFIATAVLALVLNGPGDVDSAESVDDLSGRLDVQVLAGVGIAAVALLMAYFATRALRDLDPPT